MRSSLFFYLFLGSLSTLCAANQPSLQDVHGSVGYNGTVASIYPTTSEIPVNLLRFYVQFDQPMREGEFLQHIRLIDPEGTDLTGVFFDNQYELWNADHTRLTILIDPGRIKTGLASHEELGRAFLEGERYQLVIDKDWPTLQGGTLGSSVIKEFVATQEVMESVDVADWVIHYPAKGSWDQLQIEFKNAVDHLSAHRYIVIADMDNRKIEGETNLSLDGKTFRFTPNSEWTEERYQLVINSRFEDILGNNLNGPFDHKSGTLKDQREGMPVVIPFNPEEGEENEQAEKKEAPPYKLFRASENYDYLKNNEASPYEKDYTDPLKMIGLNSSKSVNLGFGGQIRPRVEHFGNRNWEDEDETFYSQRLALHSNLNITKYFRAFGELYHGMVSLEEEEFAQSDKIDWHQAFVEFMLPGEKSSWSLRLGRQEMAMGATRLIGIREGPNIRRSFDMGRIIYQTKGTRLEAFYGKEVLPEFGAFDNTSGLFDPDAPNPTLWGVYTQFAIKNDLGKTEVYYLGFDAPNSFYNDAIGQDERHTLGIRRFGKVGKKLSYNTELMFQIGETGGKQATAWALETEWYYTFIKCKGDPKLGLKLELISGDNEFGDDKIQTFNPMFTNPAYYSLAGLIAPVNLIEFHPSFEIEPVERFTIYIEWASFYRYSTQDGVYSPPRFLNREGQGTSERFVGHQLGSKWGYEFDRHFSLDLDFSYFIVGEFLKATGPSNNALHVAPTLSYKF